MTTPDKYVLCVITDIHIGHPCGPNDFRFGKLTDLAKNPDVPQALNQLLKEKHVDTLVCCGDLIHAPHPTSISDLNKFLHTCVDATNTNVCAVLGNHDLMLAEQPNNGDFDAWEIWRDFASQFGRPSVTLPQQAHQVLCFPHEAPSCDIFLLNNWWSQNDATWRAIDNEYPFGHLTQKDLKTLDKELAKSSAHWAVVVSHFPLHYLVNTRKTHDGLIERLATERYRIHALLQKHRPCVLHFAGHTHECRITHGHGVIEVTTAAFNETPHTCRLVTITNDTLSIETYTFDPRNGTFREVDSAATEADAITFQLKQSNDLTLSISSSYVRPRPQRYLAAWPRRLQASATGWFPKSKPPQSDYLTTLTEQKLQRLVRKGFDQSTDALAQAASAPNTNHSAWEGYLAHTLTHLHESRRSFVEDINRYVTLYAAMLVAAFILAGQSIDNKHTFVGLIEMIMAVGLLVYCIFVLNLMLRKARASYSFYVASSINAAVVHKAFTKTAPHTWFAHVSNYIASVQRKHVIRLTPPAPDQDWDDESIQTNWHRIVEERWTETSGHIGVPNLYRTLEIAADISFGVLLFLVFAGLMLCWHLILPIDSSGFPKTNGREVPASTTVSRAPLASPPPVLTMPHALQAEPTQSPNKADHESKEPHDTIPAD